MELMLATEQELNEILALYQRVSDHMEGGGLNQWHWGVYPNEELIREDVRQKRLYIQRLDGVLAAAVALQFEMDPEYDRVPWTCGIRPALFHRLAIDPPMQGMGLGGGVLDDVQQIVRRAGYDCLRCDTNLKNVRAMRLYEKMGFRKCGPMTWDDTPGEEYMAYDKLLKRETPLWPIRMEPAFRSGEMTPWGGEKLRTVYGKQIPGVPTGESMEVSCIPGLESRDSMGRTLPELIAEFGDKLIGNYSDRGFPLLLKLIDAKDRLSVQVHPNDVYAAEQENGKLGKTEAWLILDAPEGAEIVYGIRPGTSLTELREACREGKAVENLLRKVPVQTGDVCYIPAGCVHSLNGGILLYEIQESSDVTYRFYDWDRTDAEGKKRELHLQKALDVTDLKCALRPLRVGKAYGTRRVLSEDSFTLDMIACGGMEKVPEVQSFGILTALEEAMTLHWKSGKMILRKGETCLLPRSVPELALEGYGLAVLAMPG